MACQKSETSLSEQLKLETKTVKKLPRISSDQRISKRPLLHPAISHRGSSSATPKVVYISSKSNFIGTIKRVRALLDQIQKRSLDTGKLSVLRQDSQEFLKTLSESIEERKADKNKSNEEVVMKSSGKAIGIGLRLASWWAAQENVKVVLRTGSVGAIDDIIDVNGVSEESRIRNVSFLEVAVKLL